MREPIEPQPQNPSLTPQNEAPIDHTAAFSTTDKEYIQKKLELEQETNNRQEDPEQMKKWLELIDEDMRAKEELEKQKLEQKQQREAEINRLQERDILEKNKLRPEQCYDTNNPTESALYNTSEKDMRTLEELSSGTIAGKKIVSVGGRKMLQKPIGENFDKMIQYRPDILPDSYARRTLAAKEIAKTSKLGNIPLTIGKPRPGQNLGENFVTLQDWIPGYKLTELGGFHFLNPEKRAAIQKTISKMDDPKRKNLDLEKLYNEIEPQLIEHAILHMISLHSDQCTHTSNMMIDLDNKNVYSIDWDMALYKPRYMLNKVKNAQELERLKTLLPENMERDASPILTKFLKGKKIPEDTLQKLSEFQKYIQTSDFKQKIEQLISEKELQFNYGKFLEAVLEKLITDKKIFSFQDISEDVKEKGTNSPFAEFFTKKQQK